MTAFLAHLYTHIYYSICVLMFELFNKLLTCMHVFVCYSRVYYRRHANQAHYDATIRKLARNPSRRSTARRKTLSRPCAAVCVIVYVILIRLYHHYHCVIHVSVVITVAQGLNLVRALKDLAGPLLDDANLVKVSTMTHT